MFIVDILICVINRISILENTVSNKRSNVYFISHRSYIWHPSDRAAAQWM